MEARCVHSTVPPGRMVEEWCPVDSSPGAVITTGCLKTTDIYFLPALEARCPKSKPWQSWAASEGSGGGSSFASCSSGCWMHSWLGSVIPVSASWSHCFLLSSAFFLLCVSRFNLPLPLNCKDMWDCVLGCTCITQAMCIFSRSLITPAKTQCSTK